MSCQVLANEFVKITGLNFDTSGAFLHIKIQNEKNLPISISNPIALANPSRVYFDINSAVLVNPKQDLIFTGKDIKEVKIGQFTVNPNVVRVVVYFNSNYPTEKLKVMTGKNGINIVANPINIKSDYFHNTYREQAQQKSDFYEEMTINEQIIIKPTEGNQQQAINQINDAFGEVKETKELIKKVVDLRTGYYLNSVTIKPSMKGFLINGFGNVTIEKPFYLTNPTRVVYDIPNAFVNPEIRNKEIKLADTTETIKIGQFEKNKARIVIISENANQYLPVYSSDNQSILMVKPTDLNPNTLTGQKSNAVAYYAKRFENGYDAVITMDEPIVHAVKRENDRFNIYLFNGDKYSEPEFMQAMRAISGIRMMLMPQIGLRLTVPVNSGTDVKTYLSPDGKNIKLSVREQEKKIEFPSIIPSKTPIESKVVVIDAGHGGSDYGAIREGVNEKDINLDISKRIAAILIKKGYQVHQVRIDDQTVSLEDRVAFSESIKPDVFISVHVNASVKEEINGVETHYYKDNSIQLAKTIHNNLLNQTKAKDRGLFKSKFYVINHTTAPAILVEVGFISNQHERNELLGEKRKQATAKAIAEGLIEYFKK